MASAYLGTLSSVIFMLFLFLFSSILFIYLFLFIFIYSLVSFI